MGSEGWRAVSMEVKDNAGYHDSLVRMWCDRCGRPIRKGEPMHVTDERWHDPVGETEGRLCLCDECWKEGRR